MEDGIHNAHWGLGAHSHIFWADKFPGHYHKWSLTICDGYFDTLKSSKM